MTLEPILSASTAVQIHLLAAVMTLALTPVMLMRRKGTRGHVLWGRFWVIFMALTAASSFWIMEIRLIGPWSPIHILSMITLLSLFNAVRAARRRKISAHKAHILGALLGFLGAGLFTLFPGRILSDCLFAGHEIQGFSATLLLGGCGLFWLTWRWRKA
jgi:uncharacterized membrane protein